MPTVIAHRPDGSLPLWRRLQLLVAVLRHRDIVTETRDGARRTTIG